MNFSIGDLLLVTVIVGIQVAWWLDGATLRKALRKKLSEEEERIRSAAIERAVKDRLSELLNRTVPLHKHLPQIRLCRDRTIFSIGPA